MAKLKTIKLNEEGYKPEGEIILNQLKKDRIYSENLLYHSFKLDKLENVLKNGTSSIDSNCIEAYTNYLFFESGTLPSELSQALEQDKTGLAVYKCEDFFTSEANIFEFKNSSKKLESLLKVYLLKV